LKRISKKYASGKRGAGDRAGIKKREIKFWNVKRERERGERSSLL